MHRSLKAWNALSGELKAIVAHACATEANYALAEMERLNAQALAALVNEHNVKLAAFPADLVAAARRQADDVLGELGARDAKTARVLASYTAFRERSAPWSRVSIESVRARGREALVSPRNILAGRFVFIPIPRGICASATHVDQFFRAAGMWPPRLNRSDCARVTADVRYWHSGHNAVRTQSGNVGGRIDPYPRSFVHGRKAQPAPDSCRYSSAPPATLRGPLASNQRSSAAPVRRTQTP
jgi:hypothetical protein